MERKRIITKAPIQKLSDADKIIQYKLKKASQYRNKQILIKYGLAPWINLMDMKRMNRLRAVQHYDNKLLKNIFGSWFDFTKFMKIERKKNENRLFVKALNYYKYHLVRKVWIYWSNYRKLIRTKAKKLSKYFNTVVILRYSIKAWKLSYQVQRTHDITKLNMIVPKGKLSIKRFYWQLWLLYIENQRIEKEANYRASKAWNKLQDWINTQKK